MAVRSFLPTVARLAVYLTALLVLATARLPEVPVYVSTTAMRADRSGSEWAGAAWRLAIAGVLLTGVVLEVSRRRIPWR